MTAERSTNPSNTETRTEVTDSSAPPVDGRIRLESRAASPDQESRRVTWTEDTVDNEHMNKKKSKICCIFHPQEEEGDCPHHRDKDDDNDPGAWNSYERQPKLPPRQAP